MNKEESLRFFIKNSTFGPNIVLIMPITRSSSSNRLQWEDCIRFVENSKIQFLIIIDKTNDRSATAYFMENFNIDDRNLFVLPRSTNESHYESLGSIYVDENIWVMQLHDDDAWDGSIALPDMVDPQAAYYSQFYVKHQKDRMSEEKGFSYPARVNFILVPSRVWNIFSRIIQDQEFHVAGSMDSTLNLMVQVSCYLEPIPNFAYFYDDHNWAGRLASRRSLIDLTKKDGWGKWATVEIALFGRLLDNLSSLSYVAEIAKEGAVTATLESLIQQFKPKFRRRIFIRLQIAILKSIIFSRLLSLINFKGNALSIEVESKLSRIEFIRNSWYVKQLGDVIDMIEKLEEINVLEKLKTRFSFWRVSLTNLNQKVFPK